MMSFFRVDPTIGTDNATMWTPVQIAAEMASEDSKKSVEMLSLLAEYAPNPAGTKAKLLKLIIESDGQQEAFLEDFKQQLELLSGSEVTSQQNASSLNLHKFKAYFQAATL